MEAMGHRLPVQCGGAMCRANLQAVHHAYAQHCEALGDTKAAMQHYTAAGAAATEVRWKPRHATSVL